ncbi:SH3 domain-containing protein [Chrysiogenes arsenatis]|uniref:SH3 domain-containing protein n=1 Tax=Chrysiogenes arsenatis TaxID=309797 RepID=UPI00041E5CAE|nr:SH3 domain-containing protein [Chrysiogenes arsenatis]
MNKKTLLPMLAMLAAATVSYAGNTTSIRGMSTAEYLNMRTGPGPSYPISAVLTKAQEVTVHESVQSQTGYQWYRVTVNEREGYVYGAHLKVENMIPSTARKAETVAPVAVAPTPLPTAVPQRTLTPRQRMQLIAQADRLFQAGRYHESLAVHEDIAAHMQPTRQLLINRAYLYGKLSMEAQAHTFIAENKTKAISLAYAYGVGHLEENRPADQLRDFLLAYLTHDHQSSLTFLLGVLHERQGDHAAALNWYAQANQRHPNNAHYSYALARMQELAGKAEEARQHYRVVTRSSDQQLVRYAQQRLEHITFQGAW